MSGLALLSSKNLPVKGTPEKVKQKFVWPFRVGENIERQVYGQIFPMTGKLVILSNFLFKTVEDCNV